MSQTFPEIAPVIALTRNDFQAAIYPTPDGQFDLTWTDYVANEWTELYPTLPLAIMRLGVLVSCADTNWAEGFAHEADEFTLRASTFLTHEVQ